MLDHFNYTCRFGVYRWRWSRFRNLFKSSFDRYIENIRETSKIIMFGISVIHDLLKYTYLPTEEGKSSKDTAGDEEDPSFPFEMQTNDSKRTLSFKTQTNDGFSPSLTRQRGKGWPLFPFEMKWGRSRNGPPCCVQKEVGGSRRGPSPSCWHQNGGGRGTSLFP